MKDSVELCQRFGRARQENRSIVVLGERHDRSVRQLELVKARQEHLVQNFDPSTVRVQDDDLERSKQRQWEISAFRSTLKDEEYYKNNPVKALNEYAQKTKVDIDTVWEDQSGNEFRCRLTYKSVLRTLVSCGSQTSKKRAKGLAASVDPVAFGNYASWFLSGVAFYKIYEPPSF